MILKLINHMAVLMVIAYVLTRTRLYTDIINKKFTVLNRIILTIIFGILSIYGTISGVVFRGAVANIRDLGPAIAGLLAGPIVGFGAGFIGAFHRFFFVGGSTRIPCAIATLIAGLAAGIIYSLRKGKFIGVVGAVLFSFLFEQFHMLLVIIINGPTPEIIAIVKKVDLPMTLANSIGMAIFMFFSLNLIKERKTEAAKERIESELKVAHDIQMGIIPKIFPPFPERPEFDIHAIIEPAKEVGGDFFDFYFVDDEHLCFTIADVSGKGVPASLFMAVSKTLLKTKSQTEITPDKILSQVNNLLCDENDSAMFVTTFYAILNTKTGEIIYSNGGHNLPYHIKSNGQITQLENTPGVALGVMEDFEYSSKQMTLAKNDILYLYTDGVNEAMDKDGNQFSYERMEEFLLKSNSLKPREITKQTLSNIREFAKGAVQSDDITVLVLKYN